MMMYSQSLSATAHISFRTSCPASGLASEGALCTLATFASTTNRSAAAAEAKTAIITAASKIYLMIFLPGVYPPAGQADGLCRSRATAVTFAPRK